MKVQKNISLAAKTTMRLGGEASFLAEVSNEDELLEAVTFAKTHALPIMVLGGGSNIIFGDNGFNGLVIINKITGVELSEDGLLKAGAGENWDSCVELSVNNGWSGIEGLSLIPGTVGGAPVNNIGAYGQEIKDTLVSVRALDTLSDSFIDLSNADCSFGYRKSIFKNIEYGRYIITNVTLQLTKNDSYTVPSYDAITNILKEQSITTPTVKDIRDIIIEIRSSKLPDPSIIANTGSFFKNPIVDNGVAQDLLAKFPEMPNYPSGKGVKLAAGWLIESAGLKGYQKDGIKVYEKQALVLVNESATNFQSLLNMKNFVQAKVYEKFGVMLEPEPEIIT